MDMGLSKQDEAFCQEVRDFLKEKLDDEIRAAMATSKNGYITKDLHIRWQKALYEKGWMAVNWPKEYGGPGWTTTQKFLFDREVSLVGTPPVLPFGVSMVAPVIMAFGNDAQKKKYLPDILASNVWWCQGYSEPGSGSDLASLQMRAEDAGDHYLCNGSKIWTTLAQYADMIFCLVRTAKMEKRQDGISFLLIDMKSPGVTVEPLRTLDCSPSGMQEVNQVFFDNVKVPKENLVGEENKGWTYAKYLLEFERGNAYSPRLRRSLSKLRTMITAMQNEGSFQDISTLKAKIDEAEVQSQALEYTELRIFSALNTGQNVGPASSILKTRGTELQQRITTLAMEAAGAYAMPFVEDTAAPTNAPIGFDGAATIAPYYYNTRKTSIYAGSNEIQRNIMAKAILGL